MSERDALREQMDNILGCYNIVSADFEPPESLLDDLVEVARSHAEPAPAGEPVAWRYRERKLGPSANWLITPFPSFYHPEHFEIQPLYSEPTADAAQLRRQIKTFCPDVPEQGEKP